MANTTTDAHLRPSPAPNPPTPVLPRTPLTQSPHPSYRKTAFKPYIRFSDREHEMLRRGVQCFGTGRWKNILNTFPFHPKRTAVDLKDKWRNILRKQARQTTALRLSPRQYPVAQTQHSSPDSIQTAPYTTTEDNSTPLSLLSQPYVPPDAWIPELTLGATNNDDAPVILPSHNTLRYPTVPGSASYPASFDVQERSPLSTASTHPLATISCPWSLSSPEPHRWCTVDPSGTKAAAHSPELPSPIGVPMLNREDMDPPSSQRRLHLPPIVDSNSRASGTPDRMNLSFLLCEMSPAETH